MCSRLSSKLENTISITRGWCHKTRWEGEEVFTLLTCVWEWWVVINQLWNKTLLLITFSCAGSHVSALITCLRIIATKNLQLPHILEQPFGRTWIILACVLLVRPRPCFNETSTCLLHPHQNLFSCLVSKIPGPEPATAAYCPLARCSIYSILILFHDSGKPRSSFECGADRNTLHILDTHQSERWGSLHWHKTNAFPNHKYVR